MSLLSDFDKNFENILDIKETYFDEACMLIFTYLDGLCNLTDRKYTDNRHNRQNYIDFLLKYSGRTKLLNYIQIDKFIHDCIKSDKINIKYGHYLFRFSEQFIRLNKNEEVFITDFFRLDNVKAQDREFFSKYTLASKVYDIRNYAVHRYKNEIIDNSEIRVPIVMYTRAPLKEKFGWYNVIYSFDFLYEILLNCYDQVRKEYIEMLVILNESLSEGIESYIDQLFERSSTPLPTESRPDLEFLWTASQQKRR